MKIEYHSLETATHEQETFRTQQIAALAAGKQNLAWYYIELFYHEQGQEDSGYVTESYLQGLAQQVPGLNLPNWSAARNDPAYAEQVTRDAQIANAAGLHRHPVLPASARAAAPCEQFKTPIFERSLGASNRRSTNCWAERGCARRCASSDTAHVRTSGSSRSAHGQAR